jgi:hypothetical protein
MIFKMDRLKNRREIVPMMRRRVGNRQGMGSGVWKMQNCARDLSTGIWGLAVDRTIRNSNMHIPCSSHRGH